MAANLLDPELLAAAMQTAWTEAATGDLEKVAYVPPGSMDPAAQGGAPPGGAPPGSPPGAPPGAPPGMPPGGDPAAMGGAPPPGAPPGMPPNVMDPSGMAGMQPPMMPPGGGMGEQKKKLDPAMLDARLFTIQQLLIGLYEAQGLPLPAKAMMGNIPDPMSQQMADQQFAQQDAQAAAAAPAGGAPPGAPPGMPPGGDPAAMGGGMPPDPAAGGMPPKMAGAITHNSDVLRLGTPVSQLNSQVQPVSLMDTLFDEEALMADITGQFGEKQAATAPPASTMEWLKQMSGVK